MDTPTHSGPVCSRCGIALIPITKPNQVSLGGLVGGLVFLIGLLVMLGSPIMGGLVMIVGLLIGAVGRGTRTVMTCPQCGKRGATL